MSDADDTVEVRIFARGGKVHVAGPGRHTAHPPTEALKLADAMDAELGYTSKFADDVRRAALEVIAKNLAATDGGIVAAMRKARSGQEP